MNKKAVGIETIVAVAIVCLLLAIGTFFIVKEGGGNIDKVTAFLPGNNVEAIVNSCELNCLEGNNTGFCEKQRVLELGNNQKIKGACVDLAKLDFKFFKIKPCDKFTDCKGIDVVCSIGGLGKKVECSSFY